VSVQRARIADAIAEVPGIHFSELVRRLDLAPGQVQYHVTRLRRRDDVLEERLYGRTHYYPPSFDEWERGAVALLRRETARDVVTYLLAEGPAGPAAVAEDLDNGRLVSPELAFSAGDRHELCYAWRVGEAGRGLQWFADRMAASVKAGDWLA